MFFSFIINKESSHCYELKRIADKRLVLDCLLNASYLPAGVAHLAIEPKFTGLNPANTGAGRKEQEGEKRLVVK
jgi:hypothetical protein